jgi:hypothetical protein
MTTINTSNDLPYLARLAHNLTVCARSTYEPGTDNVLESNTLRAYNELLHRVTGAVRDRLSTGGGIPLNDLVSMLTAFASEHERTREIEWALKASEGNR